MQHNEKLALEYSYTSLPSLFYQSATPALLPKPEVVLRNNSLLEDLNIPLKNDDAILSHFFNVNSKDEITSFAQAYAGHQFGHFTKLGDGRAIVMGEYVSPANHRFDIQLKGSGQTPYSRNGDGKATLKAMLREYLISEAMHHLKIPTSRSLFVVKSGELVRREVQHEGAVLARLMKSHIRIGTFEYARHFGSTEDLQALANYTIHRLYPELESEENPVLGLLKKVMQLQIDLVANWMRVGFIHGVMNTDNISISAETFDYGPCAFMNSYDPNTVFSAIDTQGRYAFGNQPKVIKWNIARFAEALLPILHNNQDTALQHAQAEIDKFDGLWHEKFYKMMANKIGLQSETPDVVNLVDELGGFMKKYQMDYTNTYRNFSEILSSESDSNPNLDFQQWIAKWKNTINNANGIEDAKVRMKSANPVLIPRNHLIEQSLEEAVDGDMNLFNQLLNITSKPYEYQPDSDEFMAPSNPSFESKYQTFCGT
jgi:uncharacterized protein YdiU (UPF0061 family)